MERITVDVVGLYHWDVGDHWMEYAAEAVGKQLVLQPQPDNMKDPYAVRVREGSLHIGYVAVLDLDVVYQALHGSGRRRLRGGVVESNSEPPVLTVELEVEAVDWMYEPYDDGPYKGWNYDGLSLIPKRLEQLEDLIIDLMDELEGELEDEPEGSVANCDGGLEDDVVKRDAIVKLTDKLLESNLYDMSREMTRSRYTIQRLLSERVEGELQLAAQELRQQKGMLMNHDSRDLVARYLFIEWPRQLRKEGLEESHYTYDNRLDELEQQLRAFPYQLYDKFLSDPVDFLREVYYKHVPRKYLNALLSGIVLMILKGRAKIQRWGREGDIEPIRQIEALSNPQPDDTDCEKAMKEGLQELLEKKGANGKPIITQKNQWAGFMSVLVFEYHVTGIDMTAFCNKMKDWGFGPDSGYKCFCDYNSVSKSSEYATRPFNIWRGEGTAHKRQVLAVTELRAILRARIGNH